MKLKLLLIYLLFLCTILFLFIKKKHKYPLPPIYTAIDTNYQDSNIIYDSAYVKGVGLVMTTINESVLQDSDIDSITLSNLIKEALYIADTTK